MRVLPHGGARAAILYRAGGVDLQQAKAAKEVKTLVAVKLKLKIQGRQPTTMDEAWGSGGVKPEGNRTRLFSHLRIVSERLALRPTSILTSREIAVLPVGPRGFVSAF